MNKHIITIIAFFCSLTWGYSRTLNHTLSFEPSGFELKEVKGDTSIIFSSKYEVYSTYGTDQPNLPVIYVTLLLPADASVSGFGYTKSSVDFASDVKLSNGAVVVPTGSPAPEDGKWYDTMRSYPSSIAFKGNHSECGYRTATFEVKPFSYDALTGKLSLSSFNLSLQLDNATVEARSSSKRGERERTYILNQVWNKTDMMSLYPVPLKTVYMTNHVQEAKKDKYIILTSNSLKNAFQPLLNWKKKKGLDAQFIIVDTIQNAYTDKAKKIKYCLKQQFDHHPDKDDINFYVLLGGDVNIVPAPYCRSMYYSSTAFSEDSITANVPCDMYYACLSGDKWEWNNGYGEIGDPSYYYTEENAFSWHNDAYVGRASVRTTSHVSAFINKLINMESNPPSNWGDKILFMGGPNGDYVYDPITHISYDDSYHYSNIIINEQITPYWNGTVGKLFPKENNLGYTYLSIGKGYASYIDMARTRAELKKNYSIISEMSSGTHNTWSLAIWSGDVVDIMNSTISSIISSYPKIIVSNASYSNEYDLSETGGLGDNDAHPCLGELLTRKSNSGVVAYVGYTRRSYPHTSYHTEPSDKFQSKFFEAIYNTSATTLGERKTLGEVVSYAKEKMNLNDGVERRIRYSIATLGDPETPVVTAVPKNFSLSISAGDPIFPGTIDHKHMKVSLGQIGDFQVYDITEDKLYNYSYGSGQESIFNFYNESAADSLEFMIMKPGYVPTYLKIYDNAYVQNQTITSTASVGDAYMIKVGNNVYDGPLNCSTGNVVILSGATLVLGARSSVTFDAGFRCEDGGEFEVIVPFE